MNEVSIIGLDLAKNVLQARGAEADGAGADGAGADGAGAHGARTDGPLYSGASCHVRSF